MLRTIGVRLKAVALEHFGEPCGALLTGNNWFEGRRSHGLNETV
ncbi:hypothetical protein FB008_10979 [Sinorhizobium medicae]|uniref:Uncharacterized protein n=1 Tax=Sinorhizobium medicae TaxID=110321 RepID=A0A508X5P9_9HYPH|nr:hypothetical protein FB008_10979 [Sinorhizobium medicae]VTZ63155.1 hypothetical protein EMEDMD4_490082 [Sinorhizobium medicae]